MKYRCGEYQEPAAAGLRAGIRRLLGAFADQKRSGKSCENKLERLISYLRKKESSTSFQNLAHDRFFSASFNWLSHISFCRFRSFLEAAKSRAAPANFPLSAIFSFSKLLMRRRRLSFASWKLSLLLSICSRLFFSFSKCESSWREYSVA
jgi:hypothetical protein